MEDFLQNPITWGFIIPFIVEAIKKTGKIPASVLPVLAFIIGALYGVIEFYVPGGSKTMVEALIFGVSAGGIATGLYDTQKKVVQSYATRNAARNG
jgi:hypothetical protein